MNNNEQNENNNNSNNQFQPKINPNNQNNNRSKCCICCNCSEKDKFWLSIFFFPCFMIYNMITCFREDRSSIEPYYHTFLFIDNILVCILSIVDIVLLIIYKDNVNTTFFVLRIISDSFGMIVFCLAVSCWSEEATYEDNMHPIFLGLTTLQTILMTLLDIASLILFLFLKFHIGLLISQIIHIALSLVIPIRVFGCKNYE